jgi:hypothetical protein
MPEIRVSAEQRRIVTERANNCCEYCLSQNRFATEAFSAEHIIPRFLGGETDIKNLALACQGCNGHKHIRIRGYDPVSGNEVPLYHPRRQKWDAHFRWNDDFTLIIGLTPTGRATVETLKLNRDGLVNLRQVLYGAGKHPP